MPPLRSRVDPNSEEFRANEDALLVKVAAIDALQQQALDGGGEKYVDRM